MQKRHLLQAALAATALSGMPFAGALAAGWPSRELRFVIPFAPGGATDLVFRLYSEAAKDVLGKTIVPMNMGGAGGSKGSTYVYNAPSDGYTLLGGHEFLLTTYYGGMVKFDIHAFRPICTLTKTPMFVVGHKDVPYNTPEELVAYMKANPGKVTIAMTPASIHTVFFKQLCDEAGLDMQNSFRTVIINGNGPQQKALLGKHVDIGLSDIPSSFEYIKDGRLKPIGVAYSKRLSQIPECKTFRESGFPVESAVTRAVFVRAGTPDEAVDKLVEAYRHAASNKEIVAKVEALGNEALFMDAKETAAYFDKIDPAFKAVLAQ